MDDDALRRGRPTVHVRWDEGTAVLAGDALQTLAFELVSDPRGHADGAVRTLERLSQHTPEPGALAEYFSTHPPLGERIRALREAAGPGGVGRP